MLWRTLGALLLGAAVAVGMANLIIAVGRDEPRRPPGAVVLVPAPPHGLDATVPSLPLDPPEPSAPDPTVTPPPTVVVPPPVHVDPAPAPPVPAPPAPSDDDDDDDDD